jgi:tetratricopeptide (TPR) repeat protein
VTGANSVGLALIVRDEEKHLPTLLASIEGAFDQVVLLDTGSTDKTVSVFRRWAKKESTRQADFTYKVETFEWIDDFAAARTAAHTLLDTDWEVWADADDEIIGAQHLRTLAAHAPADVTAYVFGYDYAQDENGNCACYLRRERLLRRGVGRWDGKVHESLVFDGRAQDVDRGTTIWRHRKLYDVGESSDRNLKILSAWEKEEPENSRVLGYLGTEYLVKGEMDKAIPFFTRYLDLRGTWDEERAQICRKLSACLISQGNYDGAIEVALEAIKLVPRWPDSYLSLAEAYHQKGEFDKSCEWASEVLRRGEPDTLLIINPLDYKLTPRLVLASALGGLSRWQEALQVAEEALAISPNIETLLQARQEWNSSLKREATAKTFCAAAQELVAHDEQLKALRLLEDTVPYYATDHPEVVGMRSELRERVRPLMSVDEYTQHYESGGSKPEDFIADDDVDAIGDSLPRCAFLLEGIGEQLAEAA